MNESSVDSEFFKVIQKLHTNYKQWYFCKKKKVYFGYVRNNILQL